MRLIVAVLVVCVLALGATFAALNPSALTLDFYFFQTELPAGIALLLVLASGWLLGGTVAWLGKVPTLRRKLRHAHAELAARTDDTRGGATPHE